LTFFPYFKATCFAYLADLYSPMAAFRRLSTTGNELLFG